MINKRNYGNDKPEIAGVRTASLIIIQAPSKATITVNNVCFYFFYSPSSFRFQVDWRWSFFFIITNPA